MSDLRRVANLDEDDGLDESRTGVPAPNTAAVFAHDYALPVVVPKRTHPVAVIALALAVVVPIVGIIVAHRIISKLQHEGGRGVSVARVAVVIGYLNVLVLALVAVNVAAALLLHPGG